MPDEREPVPELDEVDEWVAEEDNFFEEIAEEAARASAEASPLPSATDENPARRPA